MRGIRVRVDAKGRGKQGHELKHPKRMASAVPVRGGAGQRNIPSQKTSCDRTDTTDSTDLTTAFIA